MFELVFLLLPVAAAYGYYMGKNSIKNERAQSSSERTKNYLRGVDYFLNNEKDQALDQFIAYLDASDPSFETTLALGNVFRQRGEVDRAISLHSSLASNENVEPFESELARIELACDFISAGLLDRAETILLELIEIPARRKSAMEHLLKLYEQERDFEKAIELGLSHKDILNTNTLNRLSHYYCELAQNNLLSHKFKEAEAFLNQGLEFAPQSIRIRLMKAELLQKQKADNYENEVIKILLELVQIDKSTGIFALKLLKSCFPDSVNPSIISVQNKEHHSLKTSAPCEINTLKTKSTTSKLNISAESSLVYLMQADDYFGNEDIDKNKDIDIAFVQKDLGKASSNQNSISESYLEQELFSSREQSINTSVDTSKHTSIKSALSQSKDNSKDQYHCIHDQSINKLANIEKIQSIQCDSRYIDTLRQLMELTHSAVVTAEYCVLLSKLGARDIAIDLALSFLKERPNLKVFSSLMALRTKDLESIESSEVILQLKSIVDAQIAGHNLYRCSRCGFESSMMFWQCPSCRRWDSIRVKRSIDGD